MFPGLIAHFMIFFMKVFLQQRGTFQRSWICIKCWEKNKPIPQMVFFRGGLPWYNPYKITELTNTRLVRSWNNPWMKTLRKSNWITPQFPSTSTSCFWIARNVVRTAGFRIGDGLNWLHGGGSLSTKNISCKYQNFSIFLGEKKMCFSSWWLNETLWNIWVKMGTFPKKGVGENKTFETTTKFLGIPMFN